ncbi:MAG: BMC domain-containing protein [Chloroherpetonaceae bacterium]|nr:BMC domain-containing protein [Chloroherpetonaceae bacterium]
MRGLALGLIETRGLIAALEAADAALKSADVKLISKDRVDAALVTVKLVGEVSAVEAAVEAGAAAAARIGKLVGKHIIARPDDGIYNDLIAVEIDSRKKKKVTSVLKSLSDSKPDLQSKENGVEESVTADVSIIFDTMTLEKFTVEELRKVARKIPDFPIQGREISRSNRDELARLLRPYATDYSPPLI